MVKVLTKIRYHVKSGFRHGFKNVIFSKFFFGFVASLGVLISSHDKAGRIRDNLNARLNDVEDTFDFIIVGAGTSGCLLANRLSEQHKVLLLEAGGEPHPLQRIPGMAFFMVNYRETDWMHRTVPQRRACFSSPGRRSGWCQGRNLGGSGNLNYMVHMRGSPRDYDNWAKVTGDESWSYDALLHYFRRHENYQGDSPDREAHGFDGDMMLETPSYTGMAKEFIRAGQELGYEHVDLNARYEEGFDSIYSPMEQGERKGSFSAFLEPVRERETLVVRKYSRVNKILIRNFDNTAFGVEYDRHGSKKYAYATKEVILAAGAVESPKLLMMSGVGPKTHLADLGIPVIADLPVGKNLQDHLAVILGPFFIDPARSFLIDRDITLKSFYEYKSDGNGPLSSSIFHAAAMISSKQAKATGVWNWPDILMLLSGLAGHKTFARDMSHAFNLNQKLIKKYYHHAAGRDSFIIFVSAARPEGRGDITLEKKDASSPPSINPHYLENENDMQITIEGIKTALYLVENTTSFQNLRARFTNKKFPGCDHMPFRSDDYWQCYIRHFSVSLNDAAGSCAMGNPIMNEFGSGNGWGKTLQGAGFVGAVVDPKLQVIGINHLRIADSSVMPTITGSQTNAGVMVIAEKCADMINDAWSQGENGPPPTTYKPFGWSEQMPTPGYGPPGQEGGYNGGDTPQGGYGNTPQIGYGAPTTQQEGGYTGPPPQNQYGPPQQQQEGGYTGQPTQNQYGPPSQNQYSPPPQNQYGPPSSTPAQESVTNSYGPPAPAQQGYANSQQDTSYGPPVQQGYANSQQDTSYGPPSQQTEPPPDTSYGPPSTMMGGYTDPTTTEMMQTTGGDESMQMNQYSSTDTSSMTPSQDTTTFSTTTNTQMMSSENPMTSYMTPPEETGYADSMPETTTLIPDTQYGPPQTQYGPPQGNEGGFDNSQNGNQEYGPPSSSKRPPPLDSDQYNSININNNNDDDDNNNNNGEPPIYLTPPGLPGEDSTTMASTSFQTSTEGGGGGSYQPQLGNPIFGNPGYLDPRNIPPAGDSDPSSTTMSSGRGIDPPEENAPAGNAFDPISVDSATSESTTVLNSINGLDTSTYKSFFKDSSATDSPTGFGGSAAAASRPNVDFLNHDTKLRPGIQISNPFPDIFYATSGQQQDSSDVENSFFQKYPITSSVEFANNKPSPPNLDSIYFRNPEFTTRRPIFFGSAGAKNEAQKKDPVLNRMPQKTTFNASAVAASRASGDSPPYTPYYNDRNRRPDEGTVKPTVLYKSVGATNRIPSTANVPNIYYSVKDKVSKEGVIEDSHGGNPRIPIYPPSGPPPMAVGGGSHFKTQNPTGPSKKEILKTSSTSFSPSGFSTGSFGSSGSSSSGSSAPSGFGGSGQSSNSKSYWTNASPKPDVFQNSPETENSIQVEIAGKSEDNSNYWTNASPKPPLVGMPRGMDNSIQVDTFGAKVPYNKNPGRIRGLRKKPKDEELDISASTERNAKRRIVRIKSDMIWTTTMKPSVRMSTPFPITTSSPDYGGGGKMKIRVKTKEAILQKERLRGYEAEDDMLEDTPVLNPYWSQSSTTKSVSTTSKPAFSISGTSAPTTAVYIGTTPEPATVSPRPMLNVQLWHSGNDKKGDEAKTQEEALSGYLAHPGFEPEPGFDRESQKTQEDQDESPSFVLSTIANVISRGRPRRPPPRTHYNGGTTIRPAYAASGNSATRFMISTQVPDFFVQDELPPELADDSYSTTPRDHRGIGSVETVTEMSTGVMMDNRKKFTAHDVLGQNNFQEGGKYFQNGFGSVESTFPSPTQNFRDNSHNPHGSSGPTEFDKVPPPHDFDSGERNRFNFFEGGVSSTQAPPHSPAPPQSHHHHHSHEHGGQFGNGNYQNGQGHQAHRPQFQDIQVTTPGNDFTSPAYDESPLQFLKDATPPNRFQDLTNKPVTQHGHINFGSNGGNQHQQNQEHIEGLFPPVQQDQPLPTGLPNLPSFIENSAELNFPSGGNNFPSGGNNNFPSGADDFGRNNQNLGFPQVSTPQPSLHPQPTFVPPLPDLPNFRQQHHSPPDAFDLGHSAPVGMGGGNSPAHVKGMSQDFRYNQPPSPPPPQIQHQLPQLPSFEDPPRFEPQPQFEPPSQQLAQPLPNFDDLGQIPDIFGFRDVIPPNVQPPTGPPRPPPTSPSSSSPTQPNFEDEFGNPFGFSSPPTTALQQSIHEILTGPGGNTNNNQFPPQQQSPDKQQQSIGLPSPPGTHGIPTYLGESGPKMFEDGVDPNKISLTYDDTGANALLDPLVIQNHAGGKNNLNIDQVSITQQRPKASPQFQQNNFRNNGQQSNFQNNAQQNNFPNNVQKNNFPNNVQKNNFPNNVQKNNFQNHAQQNNFPNNPQKNNLQNNAQQNNFPNNAQQNNFPNIAQQNNFPNNIPNRQNQGQQQNFQKNNQNQFPIQFEESRNNEDVTQTRDQILSNFGPQHDPDDFPMISTTPSPPTRQQSKRPFGSRNKERHRNPFAEFGDVGDPFQNPFAELMVPQKPKQTQQNFNQLNPSPPPQQDFSQFPGHQILPSGLPSATPTPKPSPVFGVTPFDQPDFTRFDIPNPSGINNIPFHQSTVPPPIDLGIGSQQQLLPGKPKMAEYTIYSNPDDVDITVDQNGSVQSGNGGVSSHNNFEQSRRRADNLQQRRKKRRRNQLKALRGGGPGHQKRGGRAVRVRPIYGQGSPPAGRNRKRYYMLRPDENSTSTTPFPSSIEKLNKRTMSSEEPQVMSSEYFSSFMTMFGGGGTVPGEESVMVDRLLQNSTTTSLEEEELDEENLSNESGYKAQLAEEEQFVISSIPKSTTQRSPKFVPSDWSAVEAATTNATILLSDSIPSPVNVNATARSMPAVQRKPRPNAIRRPRQMASVTFPRGKRGSKKGTG